MSRKLSAHRHGAAAEGLSALPDDREESLRYVGRRRDAVAGRGEARLVRRSAGQVRPVAQPDADAGRRLRGFRHP
jgi:hypothetical protein